MGAAGKNPCFPGQLENERLGCAFNKESGKGFAVSSSGAYKVIGNAVPPMLAYNIAYRIQKIWDLYFGHDGN